MRLFNSVIQQAWFERLPQARIPYGDEDKLKEYFISSEIAKELSPDEFVFVIGKRLYLEWCLEQESKGSNTDCGRAFDYDVFEKYIADEMQYEFERSTLPDERSNRVTFYTVRHRVLDAFVQNAVKFLKENQGIDGKPENRRNLRCDLTPYLEKIRQRQAA